jgi:hypothetical protein
MIFDVDLVEVDSGARELRLEPYAVAAPAGGEDGWLVGSYCIHSHDMYNPHVAGPIPQHCIAYVTTLTQCDATLAEYAPGAEARTTGSVSIASCSIGWSSPSATFRLALGVEASDAGVDLGSLVLVDPPGWYPFG